MKKLNLDDVKNFIELNSNCKLLDTEVKGSLIPLTLICECGEIFKVRLYDFKNGKRKCNKCTGSYKLTYEEVKHYIEVESGSGCKLLSEEYKGSKYKLKIQCKCGNIFERTLHSFKQGHLYCDICSKKEKLLSYEYVFDYIASKGCELISKEYTGLNNSIEVKCSCGNIYKTTFASFKYNNTIFCPKCSSKYKYENNRLSYDEVKKYIEVYSNSGCSLITEEYINNTTPIEIKCACGNIFFTTFNQFKTMNKQQCNDCGKKKRIENRRKSHNEFCKEVYDLVGDEYTVLGEYINTTTPILMRHNKCIDGGSFDYMCSPGNFLCGKRCPKCAIENCKGEKSNFWKGGIIDKIN